MAILDKVNAKIIETMKDNTINNRKAIVDTLRLLKAEIIAYSRICKNYDEDIVVRKETSKREKAIEEMLKKSKENENAEFINNTRFEISILKEYLPPEYDEEELIQVISTVILAVNATSKKDIKSIMNELSKDGRVNKAKASKLISSILP